MAGLLNGVFGKKIKKNESKQDAPGRTFNKVITSMYFGCDDENTDEIRVAEVKQKKIDQIKELELKPMFTRYFYLEEVDDYTTAEPVSVHVVFQKEVSPEHHNMIHVTELSFIVRFEEFEEFEQMAGINLFNDFRQLSYEEDPDTFKGRDRRVDER
ncbi:MAG: hypothetical protein COA92_05945 [Sulfurovum sp.]|nr:MAG: hypothetical protein COA92_05945 [Sulfurovum sp.]